MAYKYDGQIKRLTNYPELIQVEWEMGLGLFKFVGQKMEDQPGCLTMIRREPSQFKAIINNKVDEALTAEIAADERIPKFYGEITVENLPVFKEWQERIDNLQNAKNEIPISN